MSLKLAFVFCIFIHVLINNSNAQKRKFKVRPLVYEQLLFQLFLHLFFKTSNSNILEMSMNYNGKILRPLGSEIKLICVAKVPSKYEVELALFKNEVCIFFFF